MISFELLLVLIKPIKIGMIALQFLHFAEDQVKVLKEDK